MSGEVAWQINEQQFTVEYGSGKRIRFSKWSDIGVEPQDATQYTHPETGEEVSLPGKERPVPVELERVFDKDADDFFRWIRQTKPADRRVKASLSFQNGPVRVFNNARISGGKTTGGDLDGNAATMLMCTMQYGSLETL